MTHPLFSETISLRAKECRHASGACREALVHLQDPTTPYAQALLALADVYIRAAEVFERAQETAETECSSCAENLPGGECKSSERPCGHHCNHSWSQEKCCWCKKEVGDADAPDVAVTVRDALRNAARALHLAADRFGHIVERTDDCDAARYAQDAREDARLAREAFQAASDEPRPAGQVLILDAEEIAALAEPGGRIERDLDGERFVVRGPATPEEIARAEEFAKSVDSMPGHRAFQDPPSADEVRATPRWRWTYAGTKPIEVILHVDQEGTVRDAGGYPICDYGGGKLHQWEPVPADEATDPPYVYCRACGYHVSENKDHWKTCVAQPARPEETVTEEPAPKLERHHVVHGFAFGVCEACGRLSTDPIHFTSNPLY